MNNKTYQTKIISVFPGCGKTYLKKHCKDLKISDSDSSKFSWVIEEIDGVKVKRRNPKFPKNYIDSIKRKIGKYDYIFVSSHSEVRDALDKEPGIFYGVVYPDRTLLMEWVARLEARENNLCPTDVLINNWENWISQMERDAKNHKSYVLQSGEYLEDALKKQEFFYSVPVYENIMSMHDD